jgi:PAS domain S-box-containing protein
MRAQQYVNIAGVILLALDATGRIEMLNHRGHQLLGYAEDSLLGQHWFDFIPDRERLAVQTAFNELMNGNVHPREFFENSILTRTGDERVIAWHNSLLTDAEGKPIGTLSSGTDVTDSKAAHRKLEQSRNELEVRVRQRTIELTEANERLKRENTERTMAERQLQAIYDGMVDGLLIADIATKRFVRANWSICRMLGYTPKQMLGMSVAAIHPPQDLPLVMKTFQTYADEAFHGPQNENLVAAIIPMLRADGSTFYAEVTASYIVYGGSPCLIGFFRDITERREAEEKLQREHRLLRELLRSQDRERQLIAYEIHDGLAQQLVSAIMHFESIPHLGPQSAETVERCDAGLEMLRRSLAEARRLISGLRPPILDELGVIAAIGHMVHDETSQRDVAIDYQHDVQFERLDPTIENTVYRITQECLTNALRHSQSETVRVELRQLEDRLRIKVSDWGIGFDPAIEREDSFGLEGIRERAKHLGGTIKIDSQVDQGTEITVEVPVAEGGNRKAV